MKLNGKVALITGAGTGIGTAIAKRFVADGAMICDDSEFMTGSTLLIDGGAAIVDVAGATLTNAMPA